MYRRFASAPVVRSGCLRTSRSSSRAASRPCPRARRPADRHPVAEPLRADDGVGADAVGLDAPVRLPVRPNPLCTSSAMNGMPCSSRMPFTSWKYSCGGVLSPRRPGSSRRSSPPARRSSWFGSRSEVLRAGDAALRVREVERTSVAVGREGVRDVERREGRRRPPLVARDTRRRTSGRGTSSRSAMISFERRHDVANSRAASITSVPELTKNAFVAWSIGASSVRRSASSMRGRIGTASRCG